MFTQYIVFTWLVNLCYSFVLISTAEGQNDVNLFQVGEATLYEFHSTILLNENSEDSKNVGFFIKGEVAVHSVWGSGNDRLLKFEFKEPQLHIRSRKAPSPEGFIQHSSELERFPLRPFYVTWRSGKIEKVLLSKEEAVGLANLKKGVASLFQFQILDIETNETDSSGLCKTTYRTLETTKFEKTKSACVSSDLPHVKTTDPIRDVIITSSRRVTYELNPELTHIKHIYARENHRMVLAAKQELGNVAEANQVLTYLKTEKTETLSGETLEGVVGGIGDGYSEESLMIQKEEVGEDSRKLAEVLEELRGNVGEKHLGNLVSAKAFLKLVEVARKSTKDEITKVLGAKKNKKILTQIYDILGYVQTPEAHSAVMKKLFFDREDHLDMSERYLWALSLSAHPHPEILKDLLDRHRKNDNFPNKVKETLILTIAAMARNLNSQHRKVVRNAEETIINNLNYAKGEEKYVFLRALKNLKSESTVPLLLKTISEGRTKECVTAFKALKSFDPSLWDSKVLKTARSTFLQLNKKYDSSSRTLAVDILLESQPSDSLIKDMLHYLTLNDTNKEVKQYVLQRLQMMADEDSIFNSRLSYLIKSDPTLHNYKILSPKGLSLALKRNFLRGSSSNGSLVTIQEMSGGVVKRGIVNVMMDRDGITKEMFSLGIFAGGLGSFVGGDSEGDDESANAGMELTILDTQIRPFVFFNGQGELMGHVWSGTASDRTPAFQSLVLLQDHLEYIRLGPGFVATFDLKTAMSFDLSGKIEISLWSRVADSLVEKSAGILTNGLLVIDSSFVRSQVEFSASIEPKLNLKSDIDFSGDVSLCMRVTRPDSIFRHNVFKIERIPGSKHKLRIAKYKKSVVPGTTYSLNRKNNEMCSAMLR